jgi:hypothetical protein
MAIIRRILRGASMTGKCPFPRQYGLESVKKTHQVAPVGVVGQGRDPADAPPHVSITNDNFQAGLRH